MPTLDSKTTDYPADHYAPADSRAAVKGDGKGTAPTSAEDPLVRKLVNEWMDVSRNGSSEPFKKDMQALKDRDFADGQPIFRYRNDLEALNKALTDKNLLPNMQISGVIDGQVVVREGKRYNQFGVLANDGRMNDIKDADLDWHKQKVTVLPDVAPKSLGDVSPLGVNQGDYVGDCRFEALLSSFSNANPGAVKNMIKDNENGTYTVTFPGDKDHPQTVSTPTAWERDTFSPGAPEWDAILGKAYRQRENTPFGPGTGAAQHIEGLLTGKPHAFLDVTDACNLPLRVVNSVAKALGASSICSQDSNGLPLSQLIEKSKSGIVNIEPSELGGRLKEALDQHMILTTAFSAEGAKSSTATDAQNESVRVISRHAYSIIGYDPATQTVTLRNPWGRNYRSADGESVGNGVETMQLAQFQKSIYGISVEETAPS